MNMTDFTRPTECLACGSTALTSRVETQSFQYGEGKHAATLSANVPMYRCADCEFEFMADDGSKARDQAVRRHLGVLEPEAVVRIRNAWNMTRTVFAELTGIGVASLARWETGQLIQNISTDRLLRLCEFKENIERLKSFNKGVTTEVVRHSIVSTSAEPTFRCLSKADVAQKSSAASKFRLCSAATANHLPA